MTSWPQVETLHCRHCTVHCTSSLSDSFWISYFGGHHSERRELEPVGATSRWLQTNAAGMQMWQRPFRFDHNLHTNNDGHVQISSFMYPFVEIARFLLVGSSNNWYGLACPAHCTSSWVLILSVFTAGFGVGSLSVLAWIFLVYLRPNHLSDPPRPERAVVSFNRLAAYVHERQSPGRGH